MIDAGERRPSMHELDDRDAQRTSAPADEGDVDLDETVVGGEALERLAEPHPAGSNVGRYVILERVGQGGMGVVYAAFDPELNRRVALKLLHAAKRSGTGHQGPPRARLLREAQAIARVSHPNVISVFDTGTLGDAVFVAMEYIEGPTLTRWQLDQPARAIAAMYARAGRGLAAAHDAGIVHRDFKPDNVLVAGDGTPKVLDFGLARSEPTSATRDAEIRERVREPSGPVALTISLGTSSSDVLSSPLTQDGAVVGTPRFMAPEQHAGVAADPRSDQFSFCVALYQALFKQEPFTGATLERLALAKQAGRIQRPPEIGVPGHVVQAVLRGLAADPGARWPDMHRLVAVLEVDHAAVRRRRWTAIGAAGLIAGLSYGTAELVRRAADPCVGDERVAELWNDARRAQLAEAFGAVAVPYAAREWDASALALDAYVAAYDGGYREACRATHERGAQSQALLDRRMQCLGHRRQALAALLDVFEGVDRAVVERASAAVDALPAVDACDDTDYVLASVEPPPAWLLDEVERVREHLARASALQAAGRGKDAAVEVTLAHELAQGLDYAPLRAEVALRRGQIDEGLGEWVEAERSLHAAMELALEVGADETAGTAANLLTGVVGDRLGRHDEGLRWAALARSLYRRAAVGELAFARLEAAEATVLYRMDRLDEAGAAYGHAIETVVRLEGPDATRLVSWLVNLGNVHYRAHRRELALETFERAASIARGAHGPEHPAFGTIEFGLSNVLTDLARWDEAERHLASAEQIFRASLGPEHPFVTAALCNFGIIEEGRGRADAAIARFEACRAAIGARLGADDPDYARVLENLGRLHRVTGALELARRELEQALTIRRERLGAAHSDTVSTTIELGRVELDAGRNDRALAHFAAALGSGDDVLELAAARFGMAQATAALRGVDAEARELAAAARRVYAQDGAPSQPQVEAIDRWLATHPLPAATP